MANGRKRSNDDSKTVPKTRRGHGEGTHWQREDGFWIGQIDLGRDEEGKRQRKTFSAKSEKEIVKKMNDYLYKQDRGELPKTDTTTLGGWMSTWLENYKKPKLRQTTYENYETLIKAHILNNPIGKVQVQKLTTDRIQAYMKTKAASGKVVTVKEETEKDGEKITVEKKISVPLSPRTVNLLHFLIESALKQAVKNNLVVRNVAENCELYRNEKADIKPLSSEESKRLLTVLKSNRLYAAIVIDLYAGLRRGEVLGLRWNNVDLEEGSVSIVENLVRVKGGKQFQKPKTKSSVRTIPLPEKVKNVLVRHKGQQDEEKQAAQKRHEEKGKEPYQDGDLVFCQTNGKPISPRNFQRMVKGWFGKAGLPEETRLHDLRHTFITEMINQGVDIKTLQGFTGHTDTRTLLETYAHVIEKSKKMAAQTLNAAIPDDL